MDRVFADLASDQAEVTVVLTDDEEIRALNHEYRGLDEPTDVLSFAYQEAEDASLTPELLGDIVISLDSATRYAQAGEHAARLESSHAASGWSVREELCFLIVHGALHLVGFDHEEADDEREMRAEEQRLWRLLATEGGP